MYSLRSLLRPGPWFTVIAVGAGLLSWRFGWGDLGQAEFVVWNFGYEIYRFSTAVWLISAGLVAWGLRDTLRGLLVPGCLAALVVAALLSIGAYLEPHGYKVNYDEPLHANVAKTMHDIGVSAPVQTVLPGPTGPEITGYSSSHRAALYSYLVSIAHDLFGYAPSHPFWVNAALMGGVWMTVWLMVRLRFGGHAPGLFAMLILGAIPLMTHSAFSAQADVANLFFLAQFLLAIQLYARDRAPAQVGYLIATGAMLALARSESIAYLAVIAALFIREMWRGRWVSPGWSALLVAPALMLAMAVQLILLSNPTNLTQGALAPGEAVHQVAFLRAHLNDMLTYFFVGTPTSGAPIIAWLMAIATAVALATHLRRRTLTDATLGTMGAAILYGTFYLVLLSSFWGGPSDLLMERFTLPLWLFGTLALTWVLYSQAPRRLAILCCAIPLLALATHTIPRLRSRVQWEANPLAQAQESWVALAKTHARAGRYFLAPSHYALVNEGLPAAPGKRLTIAPEFFENLVRSGKINELLILGIAQQGIVVFSADENDIATAATLREIARRPVATGIEIRLYRVDGYKRAGRLHDFGTRATEAGGISSSSGTGTWPAFQP